MSSKKNKNNGQKSNAKPDTKPAENAAGSADTAGGADSGGEDIPVQSLSDMLAFAHEAESKMDGGESTDKEKNAEPAQSEEKKAEPKPETTQAEEKKPEPKPEPAQAEEKKPEPVQEEKKTEPKPKPEAEQKSAPTGPPVSKEELERRAEAEDALDRDLQSARRKRLQEEAYFKHQREMELRKETERLQRAEKEKERLENAAEAAKKREAMRAERLAAEKAAQEAKEAAESKQGADGKKAHRKKNAVARYFNRTLFSMAAARAVAVILVIMIIAYAGAHIYINSVNDKFYAGVEARLTGQSRVVNDSSIEYTLPPVSPMSQIEKRALGLSEGLMDSDKDGLTDYDEINIYKTDPLNPDSDGDGISDGAEVRAELDPLNKRTDGETLDSHILRDAIIADKQVSVRIKGIPKSYDATLTKLENNSIQGTPGLVGDAYEFYCLKSYESCKLTFTYTDEQLLERGFNEYSLAVYRFNADTLAFEKITSELNVNNNSVSADINANGIYALCDTSILMNRGKTNIFFLIDNSGSMYPKELMQTSEENDVEFKRLDFANNLIDMLGTDANYGAAEFLGPGSYTCIASISNNSEDVKKKISDIRNRVPTFNGTEIAGAITGAIGEFGEISGYDRNYIILLTDGMPSNYDAANEKAAIEAAQKGNITIFTIGLGKFIDSDYLYNIAEETNGQFFQASNADALENIYVKIQNFMSYNQITIEEESGRKGYIIADSGFNVQKDGIGYANFRSEFAPNGADVGIAGLIRAYYTGELKMAEKGYTDSNGKSIPAYDISSMDSFADGRMDLKNVQIRALSAYNSYAGIKDKWDYKKIRGGVLHYTESTRDFIDEHKLRVFTESYEFIEPEESGFTKFIRTITFNRIKPFSSYECVLIDSSNCEDEDAAVMDMLRWYCGLPYNESKCSIYDFGYEGDTAFEALLNELATGSPAVITYGGSAMNAIRIARDSLDPNSFVLYAYDSNSPDRSTKINLVRTPVYTNAGTFYQYAASRGTVEEPLRIIVTD